MSKYLNEELKIRYDNFIKKYYPLFRNGMNFEEIQNIDRLIWYCNNSGNPIPDLRTLSLGVTNEKLFNYKKKDILSNIYYCDKGFTNYMVFPCGHAYIIIHILSHIFDNYKIGFSNIYDNFNPVPTDSKNEQKFNKIENLIEEVRNKCIICTIDLNKENLSIDKYFKYQCSATISGTIWQKPTIPKKFLEVLSKIAEPGDVVDTGGYRGLDLYLFDEGKFKKVDTYEYYPSWKLSQLQKYGYRRLLQSLKWGNDLEFDTIQFENGVELWSSWDPSFISEEEFKELDFSKYIKKEINENNNKDEIKIWKNNEWKNLNSFDLDSKFYLVDYPFDNNEQVSAYWKSNIPLVAQVSDYDYMFFDPEQKYTRIYFTDLKGNDKTII